MNTPSIEERLRRARGAAALIARTAAQAHAMSADPPAPAFWLGLSDLADQLETDVAAVAAALDTSTKATAARDVFVQR